MINLSNYSSSESDNLGGARGPIPEGSKVGVVVSIKDSQYGDAMDPFIVIAKSGLRQLNLEFTVACGTYRGVKWTERITLPEEEQNIQLSAGQTKACAIGGRQLCAILNAARGLRGNDNSPEANAKRTLKSWSEFTGLKCFVRVGIQEGSNGKQYNTLAGVIDIGSDDFKTLKDNLEILAAPKAPAPAPTEVFGGPVGPNEDIPF